MIFNKKKRKPSMLKERINPMIFNQPSILKERTDLYRLKLFAMKPYVSSKYFLSRMNNIDDYVRVKFLLGEPL